MVVAMTSFSINDALVKTLDGALGSGQVMAVRGSLACALIVPLLLTRRGIGARLHEALSARVLLRASMEVGGTLTFLMALSRLPFANIAAILQALPLAVTLGAALVFGERVGWRRWLAILVGFGGVLLIVRPGTEGFDSASLLVVLTVGFAATRDLVTRTLPAGFPAMLVSAATIVLVTLAGFGLCLSEGRWQAMEALQWQTLALAALFLILAQQFIVLAMRGGDVAAVVPFRYTSLLCAIVLGYLLFDELPDGWTLAGSAVVVATGLYTLYRETRVGRRVAASRLPTAP